VTDEAESGAQDKWADWLRRGRQRGMSDSGVHRMKRSLERVRDRLLQRATLRSGQSVIDVGAGTGLLALAVRRRVGSQGRVIAADVSFDGLVECRHQASRDGDDAPAPLFCVVADAHALPLAAHSVDRVLIRSVLIYVADKTMALREFYRVLRPGGLARLFEPINVVDERDSEGWAEDPSVDWVKQRDETVRGYYRKQGEAELRPMLNFDERDLVRLAVEAGFQTVELDYEYTFGRPRDASRPRSSKQLRADIAAGLKLRPNPHSPSYEEVAHELLGDEAEEYLGRYVEALASYPRRLAMATVFLTARKAPRPRRPKGRPTTDPVGSPSRN
jgi:arsenite methyltransferase